MIKHILAGADDASNQMLIPCLQPSDACHTLGICLAPDGNNTDEFNFLLATTNQWQTAMVSSKMAHSTADFAMHHVLEKLHYM